MTEDAFIVQGGTPLKGEVELSGAKNVALKVLIAALLFTNKVQFSNIPDIEDVRELLHLLKLLGAGIEHHGNRVVIDPTTLKKWDVDLLHGSKIRVSFMLFAPLLFRFGQAQIPNPGGCRLGARPIDRHVAMLKSFGVEINYNPKTGYYKATLPSGKFSGARFRFEKSTHTGTELAILTAVTAKGSSVIENAAQEPEVDDLIQFLNQSGANIRREKGNIYLEGVDGLQMDTSKPYHIMYDELEAATYGVFALATKGNILVKHTKKEHLKYFIEKVNEAGGGIEYLNGGIRFFYKGHLLKTDVITVPYPGFRTDWQAQWALLMTQADGDSTLHETIFENKFGYVDELKKVGAKIDFYQPEVDNLQYLYQFSVPEDTSTLKQAIKIHGPTKLHNGVLVVRDIRAGATVLIASCMAPGESIIQGASIIDRGYERIENKLSLLGANIKRV